MNLIKKKAAIIFLLLLCCSCEQNSDSPKKQQLSGSLISNLQTNLPASPQAPKKQPAPLYPWQNETIGAHPKISKEYFRCNGSSVNPVHDSCTDCGGSDKHGLPLKDGQEHIPAILIELLNHLQQETGAQVVITSGHRCPAHNSYVDPSSENQYSKHMIGAEVSFYLRGMEQQPETIVRLLLEYYRAKYPEKPEFTEFQRYEKSDTNVSIQPWYNKEIYIKLFQSHEGRNFDNRHPYPYVSVQVRWDRETDQRVTYSWQKAHYNFLRK